MLEVSRLTKAGRFREVSFALRRGEILGVTGLMGAGRTSLVSAICGLAPAEAGEIRVGGRAPRIRIPRDAIAQVSRWSPRTARNTAWCPQCP